MMNRDSLIQKYLEKGIDNIFDKRWRKYSFSSVIGLCLVAVIMNSYSVSGQATVGLLGAILGQKEAQAVQNKKDEARKIKHDNLSATQQAAIKAHHVKMLYA